MHNPQTLPAGTYQGPSGTRVEIIRNAEYGDSAAIFFGEEHRFSVVLEEDDNAWSVLDHRCYGAEIDAFDADAHSLEEVAAAVLTAETEGMN